MSLSLLLLAADRSRSPMLQDMQGQLENELSSILVEQFNSQRDEVNALGLSLLLHARCSSLAALRTQIESSCSGLLLALHAVTTPDGMANGALLAAQSNGGMGQYPLNQMQVLEQALQRCASAGEAAVASSKEEVQAIMQRLRLRYDVDEHELLQELSVAPLASMQQLSSEALECDRQALQQQAHASGKQLAALARRGAQRIRQAAVVVERQLHIENVHLEVSSHLPGSLLLQGAGLLATLLHMPAFLAVR